MINLYCDGACSGNPGPGGYAAILMYNGQEKEIVGAEKDTTNKRRRILWWCDVFFAINRLLFLFSVQYPIRIIAKLHTNEFSKHW